jgi:transposase
MAPDSLGLELRKKIIDDYKNGMSQKTICDKYQVKKSTVSRLCSKYRTTGNIAVDHKGGRPRSTTFREDSLIVRSIKKDPTKSSFKVQKELQLSVSTRTIRRRTFEAGLFSRRPAKKPLISLKNQKKRLLFAKAHIGWTLQKWRTVLFSDESKFNIFGSDGICRVRRPVGKRLDPRYCLKTVKHGGGNVMVWGCFSSHGLGPIHRINGIMNCFGYNNILRDVMLPYAEWNMPIKWIFQQDNDPKHTAKVVKQWFNDNQIVVMDWPPQSPDLNPIENLWEIVNRRIDREGVRNQEQLFEQIKKAWEAIPQSIIDHLIESMPQRCQAVIDNKGFATKY